MTKPIKMQIEELGEARIKEIQAKYTVGPVVPYPYQCVMFDEIGKRIARYKHPFYLKASVSAGKTIGFAMVASRIRDLGLSMMILARQSDIVSQDAAELSNYGVPNSVYCAGLNTKSAYFPIVVGSEGTVVNGLFKALGDFVPSVVGIDECHQVDWEDLADAIAKEETMEQMSRGKDVPYRVNEHIVEANYEPNEWDVVEFGTGRTQYTQIIIELMRRCKEINGKELRIFGMTGSEFRGTTPILVEDLDKPGFWREQATDIDTNYLIDFGSVVPTVFGDTEGAGYDLEEFHASSQDGGEFGAADLKKMEKKIHDSGDMTKVIMQMVVERAKTRNGVLITCAGHRHCKEAASHLPPGSTYAIITESMSGKKRGEILEKANRGEVKYIFQVMALTTGVNVPFWDFSVILRKIGSLTLLIQLLGRGMRLLKGWQMEAPYNFKKEDHLVWDFAGTMDELGQLYFDPILEQAQYQKRGKGKTEIKLCPICNGENSFHARRCIHKDANGNRCEYFWTSQRCDDQKDERTGKLKNSGCGTLNDIVARQCRCCGVTLKDPNEKLTGKHYTMNDWYEVVGFDLGLTRNQAGIIFNYVLVDKHGDRFTATEKFFPESDNQICGKLWRQKGVFPHVQDPKMRGKLGAMRSARKIIEHQELFMAPKRVTHRRNGKKEDIISRKEF
ncbi:DEAD/DEAH box helicase [Gibbsiella quercinecans]|uniref:DEAD/DEAH box helicase n=1 Tax=Gibbsiella quercinecans TaxID=929813 RepID=UPI002430B209|nr:helicase-related protein [Gibbsiella quercinecans]